MYDQPPAWLVVGVAFAVALPLSSVFGLLAVWAWKKLVEQREVDIGGD